MTVVFDETVNMARCWAFSKEGKRCDLLGGHVADHVSATTWTDEETYDPAQLVFVPVLDVPYLDEQPRDADSQPQETHTAPIRHCVVCEHPFHETDGCDGKGPAGMSCDCRTPV